MAYKYFISLRHFWILHLILNSPQRQWHNCRVKTEIDKMLRYISGPRLMMWSIAIYSEGKKAQHKKVSSQIQSPIQIMSMSQIIVRMVFDNGSIETHSAVKTSWNSTLPDLTYWTLCVSFTQVNKYIPLRHHYPTVWHMSQVFRLWILWIIGGGQTEDPNLYEGIIFGRAVAEWKKIARGYLIKWPLSEHLDVYIFMKSTSKF